MRKKAKGESERDSVINSPSSSFHFSSCNFEDSFFHLFSHASFFGLSEKSCNCHFCIFSIHISIPTFGSYSRAQREERRASSLERFLFFHSKRKRERESNREGKERDGKKREYEFHSTGIDFFSLPVCYKNSLLDETTNFLQLVPFFLFPRLFLGTFFFVSFSFLLHFFRNCSLIIQTNFYHLCLDEGELMERKNGKMKKVGTKGMKESRNASEKNRNGIGLPFEKIQDQNFGIQTARDRTKYRTKQRLFLSILKFLDGN